MYVSTYLGMYLANTTYNTAVLSNSIWQYEHKKFFAQPRPLPFPPIPNLLQVYEIKKLNLNWNLQTLFW